MARDYWFAFGSQPSVTASLAPTFITFVNGSGQTQSPPSITETFAGTGLYKVTYSASQTIGFVMDGATTGLDSSIRYIFGVFDPADSMGLTLSALGSTLVAIGTSNIALGTSNIALGTTNVALGLTNFAIGTTGVGYGASNFLLISNLGSTVIGIGNTVSVLGGFVSGIGDTSSPFGDSTTNPGTIFGYAKRIVEFLEGNQIYTKATGGLTFSSRGNSALLASKTVADTTTTTTKS